MAGGRFLILLAVAWHQSTFHGARTETTTTEDQGGHPAAYWTGGASSLACSAALLVVAVVAGQGSALTPLRPTDKGARVGRGRLLMVPVAGVLRVRATALLELVTRHVGMSTLTGNDAGRDHPL